MKRQKSEIITFKVDPELADALNSVSNKSAFIRAAVTSALGAICPLCNGSGILTPCQKEHWDVFAASHEVQECQKCHEPYLICEK